MKPIWMKLTLSWLLLITSFAGSAATAAGNVEPPLKIKVLTLNLHNGKAADQQSNLSRFAQLVAFEQPDIIALQEVQRNDVKKLQIPGYHWIAGPNANSPLFHFGNALLSRHPIQYHRHHYLPSQKEQRGVDEIALQINGQSLRILNTHLGLGSREQQSQIAELTRLCSYLSGPLLITGDFNLEPSSRLLNGFSFREALSSLNSNLKTFPAHNPTYQIDQVWYSSHFTPLEAKTLSWYGSDHLPVLVSLQLSNPDPFTMQPVDIPDLTRANNPLLPDVGRCPFQLDLAVSQQPKKGNAADFSGCIAVEPFKNLQIQARYQAKQSEVALSYAHVIDLRDYFSLHGIRGKAEWNFSLVSDLEGANWLEWSQYYRWSNRWGTKWIVASGERQPDFTWEQIYLPSDQVRLSLQTDTDSQVQAGIAYAINRQQLIELTYLTSDAKNQFTLGWSYRWQ